MITNATPHEVYFQAQTLFRKSNRFAYEHTEELKAVPEYPTHEISPADVYEVVNASLSLINHVLDKFKFIEHFKEPLRDPSKTPSDVYSAILEANRQLNLLLDRQFSPLDVYEEVSLAIKYAFNLLEFFPNATVIPDPRLRKRQTTYPCVLSPCRLF